MDSFVTGLFTLIGVIVAAVLTYFFGMRREERTGAKIAQSLFNDIHDRNKLAHKLFKNTIRLGRVWENGWDSLTREKQMAHYKESKATICSIKDQKRLLKVNIFHQYRRDDKLSE